MSNLHPFLPKWEVGRHRECCLFEGEKPLILTIFSMAIAVVLASLLVYKKMD